MTRADVDLGSDAGEHTTTLVAGRNGLVGSAIWRRLVSDGHTSLVGPSSAQLDLRDRTATFAFLDELRPTSVIDAAAHVGGILANSTHPAEFLSDNLRIQLSLIDASHAVGVDRFLFLGSSCIYPKFASQPIVESSLLTGPLEPTNDAYAIAKIAGILQIQTMRRQYGHRWISALPTNLYGPGDNFNLERAHVLPALIRRFHEAKESDAPNVTIWGTGTPRREFLHVDDLARACVFLLEHYDDDAPINVGVGRDIAIIDLAYAIAEIVGYTGAIKTDPTKPDGTPRKLLDVTRMNDLGWKAEISLEDGIRATYRWYLQHIGVAPT